MTGDQSITAAERGEQLTSFGQSEAGVFSGECFAMPASAAQERFYAFSEAYPESRVWNVAVRWSLRGPLKRAVLEKAIQLVCARHEALRTCLEMQQDGPPKEALVQKVASELNLFLPMDDLRHLREAQKEAEAERITLEEARRPFVLADGPLIRARLLQLEDEHHIVLVTVHHAIADGWSIGIISRDLGAYYAALVAGTAPKLAELPVQFADYAIWQKEALEKGSFQPQLNYWKKQLRGLQPLVIAADRPPCLAPSWDGRIVSELLPREMSEALARVSQRSGTTMFTTALSALYVLMNALSGRDDIGIGTQIAGRNRVEVENAIGVFSNALVLRARVEHGSKFQDLLSQVSDVVIQGTANQDVPHERVLQALGKGNLAGDRLYYVNFIYQRSFIENIRFADIQLTDMASRTPGAPYDLNFFMVERPEGWRLSLEYNTDLYSFAAGERFFRQFRSLLEEVAVNPDRTISEFLAMRDVKPMLATVEQRNATVKSTESVAPKSARPRLTADTLAPASLAQQRFWVLEQLGQGGGAFNIPIRWLLKGELRPEALERAFNELIRRHEVLRTTLIQVEGKPMQRIAPALSIQVPVIDLRTLPEQKRKDEAERITRELGGRGFELSMLPLIRAAVIRMDERESVLHVTVHHIAADGWAVGLMAREIGDLYDAYLKELPSPLPEPEMQYADYAAWQRELLESGAVERQNEYWRERFRGHVPFEIMPDKPRSAVQTTKGDVVSIQLPRTVTDAVREVSRQNGNTFFVTACAAFLVLLRRYSGQDDITIGTQVSGRNQVEHEGIIGLLLNTLPLRNDLSGDPLFPVLLERLQETVMQALANQDTPFEQLVEIINPRRDLSRNPLFQVNFMLQRSLVTSRDYDRFSLVDVPSRPAGAMYDLNCLMVERPDGWRASIQFNTDLFEPETASRMLGHFQRLLEEVGKNPERRISEFPLITEAEERLLAKWNDTSVPLPAQRTVHEFLQAQVERTPRATAVVCGGEERSYGALERRSNQLARYLGQLGVLPGMRVGLCLERSVDMMAGLLGILKAGASYVPLDPSYPAARLQHMMEDSQAVVLVTLEKLRSAVPASNARVVCLDAEAIAISRQSAEAVQVNVSGEHIAYVIYTSGSTGKPKGVQISHRAVVNLLHSMQMEPGIDQDDVLVAVTTLSFDIAALELFLPLSVGARLVIATREQASSGAELLELLQRSRATMMQATPATWQMLLDASWKGNPALKMLCGGEALARGLADRLLQVRGELWNMYGPTETTIWSSTGRVKPGTGAVTLGLPIANTQFHVLDQHLRQTPLGVPGELYIGGMGLAAGYLNQPEMTREKFVADPFSAAKGGRLYRTGDLVRWKMGGELVFLGRTDHQVKVRGFRIEAGEIEACIAKHPEVKETAVVAREDGKGSRYLVAYVVPRAVRAGQAGPLPSNLRTHLQQSLPEYMQPSAIVRLEELPRTPNGKVDRKALPAPDLSRMAAASQVGPANETERRMLAIWEKVLGISNLSTAANFFDVGGHSLLAAQLLARIEKELRKKLPLTALFQFPTVRGLATLLAGKAEFSHAVGIAAIQPKGSKLPIFCLHGVPSMHNLALELGQDQPFLSVNIPDGAELSPPYSVEQLAEMHLRTIQKVQPEGPYFLTGWCREALLAYEVAQRLRTQGQEVGLVAMFDTWVPGFLERFDGAERRAARRSFEMERVCVHERNMKEMNLRQKVSYVWAQLGTIIRDRMRYTRVAVCYRMGIGIGAPRAGNRETQDDVLLVAVKSYRPKKYEGPVILFRSDKYRRWKYWDRALGWAHLLRNFTVHEVPGVHDSMLTGPSLPSIAQAFREAMEQPGGARIPVTAGVSRG
jgi:amino acid adenylation domain-containing protein